MLGSQYAELQRALDDAKRLEMFLNNENIEFAKERVSFVIEHLTNAMMTDQELIQHAAACRSYERNGVILKGIL